MRGEDFDRLITWFFNFDVDEFDPATVQQTRQRLIDMPIGSMEKFHHCRYPEICYNVVKIRRET
jgi:hypothetical protein